MIEEEKKGEKEEDEEAVGEEGPNGMQVWITSNRKKPYLKKHVTLFTIREGEDMVKDIIQVTYKPPPPGSNPKVASKLANHVPKTSSNSNAKVFSSQPRVKGRIFI